MAPVTIADLTKILNANELKTVVDQYDPVTMGQLLSFKLLAQYPAIRPELTGIGDTIYPELNSKPDGPLSAANRERCLVALLACRSRRLELAIHVYMALANGVTPAELAHIVVATGIYTGVDTISNALDVLQGTFTTLQKLAQNNAVDPGRAIAELAKGLPA